MNWVKGVIRNIQLNYRFWVCIKSFSQKSIEVYLKKGVSQVVSIQNFVLLYIYMYIIIINEKDFMDVKMSREKCIYERVWIKEREGVNNVILLQY